MTLDKLQSVAQLLIQQEMHAVMVHDHKEQAEQAAAIEAVQYGVRI